MAKKRTDWLKLGSGKTYAHRTHHPLQCLIFITPLLLFYQIAAAIHPFSPHQEYNPHVVAFLLILKFFNFLGIFGAILPLITVVVILLFWHLARHDPWDFDLRLYAGMAVESVVWAVPLVVIGMAITSHIPRYLAGAASSAGTPWSTEVVISVGAGVYEEFLFRFIAFNLLHLLLVDVGEMKNQYAVPLIIVIAAAAFSAYHYLGEESFTLFKFFFRFALGIYLGGIYFFRGYGITVGAHTLYDLIVVSI